MIQIVKMLVVNQFSHKDLLLKTCNLHPHPIVEHAIEDLLLHILQHLRLISFGFFVTSMMLNACCIVVFLDFWEFLDIYKNMMLKTC